MGLGTGGSGNKVAALTLRKVGKRFGEIIAVDAIDLEVRDGEFIALLGPSGCGKTTILRLIAGFEKPSAGEIAFDDEVVSGAEQHLPPEKRRVGIVFQSYALWPHMSVANNVGYPLRVARIRGAEYERRTHAALAAVGLSQLGKRRPAELSGGQRQRVALARCLVMEPTLVLLDEPLANLDAHLRASMEETFVAFHQKTKATMVYVTHDQAEAMAMADRIAVMDHARLVQVADPHTLYREPRTPMVADFIGQGVVVDAIADGPARGGSRDVDLFGQRVALRCGPEQRSANVKVSLRPEDLAFAERGVAGTVRRRVYKGGMSSVEVVPNRAPESTLLLSVNDPPETGAAVCVAVKDGWVIPG